MILIHIEVQAQRRRAFPRRMFEYYALFFLRHQIPIFPVALYLSGRAGGLTTETFVEQLFGRELLRFRYQVVGLPDLSADDYITLPNPLGPTLSSRMRFRRSMTLPRRKTAILGQRAIIETNEGRRALLLNVIDTFIQLDEAQQVEFQRLIDAPEFGDVRQMITSYEQRGREIGLQEGVQQGMQQGMQRLTMKAIEKRFGTPPPALQARIEAITSPEELERLFDQIATAASLEEVSKSLN